MKQVSIRRFGTAFESGWIIVQSADGRVLQDLKGSPSGLPLPELQYRMKGIENLPRPKLPGALRNDTDVIGKTVTGKCVMKKHVEAMLADYVLIDAIHGAGTYESIIDVEEAAALKVAREAMGGV